MISKAIHTIGVDDTTLDLFESQYRIPEGISYNSYVILDEKVAVLDTVDRRGQKEWEERLMQALDGRTVDYLILQHMEPDHSGGLKRLLELYPDLTLVGNAKTFPMVRQFYDLSPKTKTLTVKEGDTLCLGTHILTFYMAPMVHWPEVMVTYESSEKVLFSADAFGRFGALALTQQMEWAQEARRYYVNIVGKYGAQVQGLLKKAAALDIACICPLHGPILDEELGAVIDLYRIWSSYEPETPGILVAYASIHGNTAAAAKELAEILAADGMKVQLCDLSREDLSEAVANAFRYDRMVLAAATYDGGLFPCMSDFLSRLQSKGYQKRRVGLMENGTWAPMAAKHMRTALESMKNITILEPTVTIRSAMNEGNEGQIRALAQALR